MTTSLFVTPQAELDLTAIFLWYERQREGLGTRFIGAADKAFTRVRQSPRRFPEVIPGYPAGIATPLSVWLLLLARGSACHRPCGPTSASRSCSLAEAAAGLVELIMRRATSICALVVLAVAWTACSPPAVIPIEASLVEVTAGVRTRLDPPGASYSTVTFVVDAPDGIREMEAANQVYGELRVAPAGPYCPLEGRGRGSSSNSRTRWELVLALLGGDRPTAETLRDMFRRRQTLEVRMRVFNGSRVVAESGWMDATALLASIADQVR